MLEIVLAVLAVYRVARMLAMEDGPFDVFANFRARFDPEQKTSLGRGINCPLCISWWLAAVPALWIAGQNIYSISMFVLLWQGIAGAVVIVHLWIEK